MTHKTVFGIEQTSAAWQTCRCVVFTDSNKKTEWLVQNYLTPLHIPTTLCRTTARDFKSTNTTITSIVSAWCPDLTTAWKCTSALGLCWIWLFQIWPEPDPDLGNIRFPDHGTICLMKLMASMLSVAGGTVQCIFCYVTICQFLTKFVEWQWT